jgi:hypothetical protein
MQKVRILAVAAMLVLVSLFALSPANATKGCVTPKEFAKAKTGMSVSAVAKLFGTNGKVLAESEAFGVKVVMRDYKACTSFGAVSVMFSNGKLESKSGIF